MHFLGLRSGRVVSDAVLWCYHLHTQPSPPVAPSTLCNNYVSPSSELYFRPALILGDIRCIMHNTSKAPSPPPPAYEALPSSSHVATPSPSLSPMASPAPAMPQPSYPQPPPPRGGTPVHIGPQAYTAYPDPRYVPPYHHPHHVHPTPSPVPYPIGHQVPSPGPHSPPPHGPPPVQFHGALTQPLVRPLPYAYFDPRAVHWLAEADARAKRRFWGAFCWAVFIWWILSVFIGLEMRIIFGDIGRGGHRHGNWAEMFGKLWASS